MSSSSMKYTRFQTNTKSIEGRSRTYINLDSLIDAQGPQNFPSVRWIDMMIAMTKSLQETNQQGQWLWNINAANMMFNQETRTIRFDNLDSSSLQADKDQKQATCAPIDKHHPDKDSIAPELKDASKAQVVCDEKTEVYGLGQVMRQIFKTKIKDETFDPEVRKSIAEFIEKMTAKSADDRPTLEQVKDFFSGMREDLLNTPALLNRVVLVDVNEYAQAEYYSLVKMNKALQGAHEVWLFDDKKNEGSPAAEWSYHHAMQRLEDNLGGKVIINNKIIMRPENTTVADVAKFYSVTRELNDGNLYVVGLINTKGGITYPENVSSRHLDKIIKSLESDLARINQKYPDKNTHKNRKGALLEAIQKLNTLKMDGQPIKYVDLAKDLNTLQSKLTSKHLFRRILSQVTDSTFHVSRENVKQLIKGMPPAEDVAAPPTKKM